MSERDYDELARDLIARTERAVRKIAELAVDTGVTFSVADIVEAVEDDLPDSYPAPAIGTGARRDMIARMAVDVLSGDLYDDES